MCTDRFDINSRNIIDYCYYCHREIYEGEGCLYIEGKGWVHYDSNNPLNNCYFEKENYE